MYSTKGKGLEAGPMGLSFAGIDAAQGQGQKPILVNDSAKEAETRTLSFRMQSRRICFMMAMSYRL